MQPTIVGTVVALVASAGLLSPTATADDKVVLGGGAGIALNGDLCTLATIGHDSAGNLIGFTSAHCGGPSAPVNGGVGTVVAANGDLDYEVLKFDPAKVTPIPNVDGFAINGIGPDPGYGQGACKLSRATGQSCFPIGLPGVQPSTVEGRSYDPGDDGAPVTVDGQLIGMIRDGFTPRPPLVHPRPDIVLFSAVLNDANAKGGPGAGFTPIPA